MSIYGPRQFTGLVIILALVGIIIFLIDRWQFISSNELRIDFLDVGQGDAIFITAPGGQQVLVDGGPGQSVLRELGKVMPFYDRSIDMVVLTHPDADHIGGLPEVVSRFSVGYIVAPEIESDNHIDDALWRVAKRKDVARALGVEGFVVIIDPVAGVYLEVLGPRKDVEYADINDHSVVMRLVYGSTSFLLMGDASKERERELVNRYAGTLATDVLKVGHHGSNTSTSDIFVSAVSPDWAVISAGSGNRYGHPHSEVISTLEAQGVDVLETSVRGRVRFSSDGERVVQH